MATYKISYLKSQKMVDIFLWGSNALKNVQREHYAPSAHGQTTAVFKHSYVHDISHQGM